MLNFTSRPVGYITVGSLAMLLGLATGVGLAWLFGDSEPATKVVVVAEAPVVMPKISAQIPRPIPIPPSVPLLSASEDEEQWTEIPKIPEPEKETVTSAAPAPWPELADKIVAERHLAERLLAEQVQKDLLASEEIWPTDIPGEVEAVVARVESEGDRIDREAEAWEAHSVTVPDPAGKPMISIVIDDLGLNRRNTVRAIRLPGPLTLAFLTYAEDLERQTSSAHAAGHELMVHFPMEPRNPDTNPGPNALREGLGEKELRRRLKWGLSRFEGYVGVNNHMGSAFTGYGKGMAVVMDEMRSRSLLFLDSLTTQNSTGRVTAAQAGVPFVARDVFLDNEIDARHIEQRLAELERVARRQGHAIAIGHPHGATIEALARWLPKLEAAGFVLVPVSMIVKHRRGA